MSMFLPLCAESNGLKDVALLKAFTKLGDYERQLKLSMPVLSLSNIVRSIKCECGNTFLCIEKRMSLKDILKSSSTYNSKLLTEKLSRVAGTMIIFDQRDAPYKTRKHVN